MANSESSITNINSRLDQMSSKLDEMSNISKESKNIKRHIISNEEIKDPRENIEELFVAQPSNRKSSVYT